MTVTTNLRELSCQLPPLTALIQSRQFHMLHVRSFNTHFPNCVLLKLSHLMVTPLTSIIIGNTHKQGHLG